MEKLDNGVEIPSRIFHYLLDWNERDGWKTMISSFSKQKLCTLELHEVRTLFMTAVASDLEVLRNTKEPALNHFSKT